MAFRIQVPRKARWARIFFHPAGRVIFGVSGALALIFLGVFTYYWVKYSRLIDRKLRLGPFQSTSMVFAAPRAVSVGDEMRPAEIIAQLRSSGYGESSGNRIRSEERRVGKEC